MLTKHSNGFFAEVDDLRLVGEKRGLASKGYELQPPDMRGGSISQLNAYQDKVRSLLANLGEGMRAQFQWTCNSDYRQELTHYFRETEKVTHPHLRQVRTERFQRYWDRMHRRDLRREQLVLFVSTRITVLTGKALTLSGLETYYAKVLGQLSGQFDELTGTLRTILGSDTTVAPLDDLAHFSYYSRFLQPVTGRAL